MTKLVLDQPSMRLGGTTDTAAISVGQTIRALRESRTDMSARALSIASGLSDSYVGKVEAGTIEPSFRALAKICIQLRMKPGEFWVLAVAEAGKP